MRYHATKALPSLLLILLALPAGLAGQEPGGRGPEERKPTRQTEFQSAMRRLWSEHITWTRQVIVSTAAGLPDRQAATERLLRNQEDIGDAIKPYYGDEAGDRLTGLLKEHIAIAGELLTAARAGQDAGVDSAQRKWKANADSIAGFLSQANPQHWKRDEVAGMLHTHLDITAKEAQARLRGDWDADIAAYDDAHEQALEMADALSAGIIHQFPRKFDRMAAR
ncbi:MAG TPA: hypothetical protein VFH97_04540 [Gemmatimonadales bacterium]|nr:hypothetical protein [Gemmatimonadales bacterium]